jgi:dipeptidase D
MSSKMLARAHNRDILAQLAPHFHSFTKWFLAVTEIPHGPHDPFPLSNRVCAWCRSLSVPCEQDAYGNICAHVPAHGLPADAPVVAIQAHLDMVHIGDFCDTGAVDVSLDGTVLTAARSTLGADDGFGVALMLDLLESRTDFPHGPLELIFTADEEVGLYGAGRLPARDGSVDSPLPVFRFRYLINCDALSGDRVYVGCNGASQHSFTVSVATRAIADGGNKRTIEVRIGGLTGGHSGCCIHLNRMSAIKALARALASVVDAGIEIELSAFSGGELINVIPRESHAVFAVRAEMAKAAVAILRERSREIFAEHALEDREAVFDAALAAASPELAVVSAADSKRLVRLVLAIPHGCMRRSPFADFDGAVDASVNLAVVRLGQGLEIQVSVRGAIASKCTELDMTAKTAVEMAGLPWKCDSRHFAVPWVPNVHSRLARLMVETYEEVHGVRKSLGLLPCTIETAAFVQLGYDAEMVAVSPSVPMAHRIGEFVDLEECLAWKEVIVRLLGKLTT